MYFTAKELLSPPTERAAFSDRQAYVCAELSNIAYFRFEGGHTLDQALAITKAVFGDDARLKLLETQLKPLLTSGPNAAADGKAALDLILGQDNFKLIETFSRDGTQAFLCTRSVPMTTGGDKVIAYLAFRGTQPTEFEDIRTDVSASLEKVELDGEGFQLHSGYLKAFGLLQADIDAVLKATPHDQLILTGHSLGGALAIVTTRLLFPDSNGACYTFGAPPVGTIEVQNRLKTPIYQIINEIDIVPRLPNPWSANLFLWLLRGFHLLARSITVLNSILARGNWDERLESYVVSMTQYRHPGYISYLTGADSNARLRFNVSSFDLFSWWARMIWKKGIRGYGVMAGDHSVEAYVAKLKTNAQGRR